MRNVFIVLEVEDFEDCECCVVIVFFFQESFVDVNQTVLRIDKQGGCESDSANCRDRCPREGVYEVEIVNCFLLVCGHVFVSLQIEDKLDCMDGLSIPFV